MDPTNNINEFGLNLGSRWICNRRFNELWFKFPFNLTGSVHMNWCLPRRLLLLIYHPPPDLLLEMYCLWYVNLIISNKHMRASGKVKMEVDCLIQEKIGMFKNRGNRL